MLAEAHELVPEDLSLQGLEALALYEQSEVGLDLWPTAVAKLEKLVASPEAPPRSALQPGPAPVSTSPPY